MKVGDGTKIAGETTIVGYEKQIELLSYSHSVAMPMTADVSNTKRTSGTAHIGEFTISKLLDEASASLNQNCVQGTDIGDVIITLLQNDQGAMIEMMKYTLKTCLVSSISVGGGGGGVPAETVTLNFTGISWDYKPQKSAGTAGGVAAATWNLATNSATLS
jgi:type VI secretion system secreted protein Hcp